MVKTNIKDPTHQQIISIFITTRIYTTTIISYMLCPYWMDIIYPFHVKVLLFIIWLYFDVAIWSITHGAGFTTQARYIFIIHYQFSFHFYFYGVVSWMIMMMPQSCCVDTKSPNLLQVQKDITVEWITFTQIDKQQDWKDFQSQGCAKGI